MYKMNKINIMLFFDSLFTNKEFLTLLIFLIFAIVLTVLIIGAFYFLIQQNLDSEKLLYDCEFKPYLDTRHRVVEGFWLVYPFPLIFSFFYFDLLDLEVLWIFTKILVFIITDILNWIFTTPIITDKLEWIFITPIITDILKWIFTTPILTPSIYDFVFYFDDSYDYYHDYNHHWPDKEVILTLIALAVVWYALYLQKAEDIAEWEQDYLIRDLIVEYLEEMEMEEKEKSNSSESNDNSSNNQSNNEGKPND